MALDLEKLQEDVKNFLRDYGWYIFAVLNPPMAFFTYAIVKLQLDRRAKYFNNEEFLQYVARSALWTILISLATMIFWIPGIICAWYVLKDWKVHKGKGPVLNEEVERPGGSIE